MFASATLRVDESDEGQQQSAHMLNDADHALIKALENLAGF